jgi:hypothetical protein
LRRRASKLLCSHVGFESRSMSPKRQRGGVASTWHFTPSVKMLSNS